MGNIFHYRQLFLKKPRRDPQVLPFPKRQFLLIPAPLLPSNGWQVRGGERPQIETVSLQHPRIPAISTSVWYLKRRSRSPALPFSLFPSCLHPSAFPRCFMTDTIPETGGRHCPLEAPVPHHLSISSFLQDPYSCSTLPNMLENSWPSGSKAASNVAAAGWQLLTTHPMGSCLIANETNGPSNSVLSTLTGSTGFQVGVSTSIYMETPGIGLGTFGMQSMYSALKLTALPQLL